MHAQGPADRAHGRAVPRAGAARPLERAARRACSATPTCSAAASTAATSCACTDGSSASATSCRSTCARSSAPPGADPAAFLPVAYRDVDELDGFLEHLAREVHDPRYRGLLDALLQDAALRAEWRRAPCTRAGHHAYLGGLLEHTVAVATLALEACPLHPRLNSDLLICAALVHDLGKTREFTYGAEIGLTDEGRLLGHVVLGQQLLEPRPGALDDDRRRVALLHCVLCHHGPDAAPGRRFGSPEALALYRLNALDAGVKGALEHGLT